MNYLEKIIIGTWSISGDYGNINLKDIQDLFIRSYENNFKEFDTAPNYGNGFAEFLLGNGFAEYDDVKFNTKIGNPSFKKKNFDLDSMEESVNNSLKRLQKDNVNILFLHNPRGEIENYDNIFDFYDKMKSNAIIKYSGISLAKNYKYNLDTLNFFDFLQIDFNILFTNYVYDLLKNYKGKIIARSPYASGILTGRIRRSTKFKKKDQRYGWLKGERLNNIMKQVDMLEKIAEECNMRLIDLAKSFVINDLKINKVIFGLNKESHIDYLSEQPYILTSKKLDEIINLNKNHFYLNKEKYLGY